MPLPFGFRDVGPCSGTGSPTGPVVCAPGSLARRRLVRVIYHHHHRALGGSVARRARPPAAHSGPVTGAPEVDLRRGAHRNTKPTRGWLCMIGLSQCKGNGQKKPRTRRKPVCYPGFTSDFGYCAAGSGRTRGLACVTLRGLEGAPAPPRVAAAVVAADRLARGVDGRELLEPLRQRRASRTWRSKCTRRDACAERRGVQKRLAEDIGERECAVDAREIGMRTPQKGEPAVASAAGLCGRRS